MEHNATRGWIYRDGEAAKEQDYGRQLDDVLSELDAIESEQERLAEKKMELRDKAEKLHAALAERIAARSA